ncbi:histidinol-phosphatase [Ammoniphilus sp. CFH 90114]|uniref:histidinol-phosphatase n=1 Tax=Ammoniphilus sp. CFH 90114 TaxID=2493665 RepID=UPI00100DCF9E|nr:histidinol-phosphatase [Ammoniphilus sp. CFH 90114]RXT06444.1 histidinol-phosphatase HisJ family protein [Ammoniphilus sp. CFH 90114]
MTQIINHDLKFDLHTHHDRCGHARGTIRDYIEAGLKKGLNVIGISDHTPYFTSEEEQPYPHIAMGKSQFPEYVKEVLRLKDEYRGKIDVLLGVESDFFPEHVEVYKLYYDRYPFDYIIGSVHHVEGINIFKKERWEGLTEQDKVRTKEAYFNLIEHSARSGMYQILGHIDAMKGYYPAFSSIQTAAVEQTLKVIGENEMAIEINTSGKTKDVGGWYPADDILEMALRYGVKVTFGSDAHDPERVGDDWEQVVQSLKEIGFKEWVYFKERKRVVVPLY